MPKITYLIGAGASAGDVALPIVKSVKDENGRIIKEGLSDAFNRIGKQIFEEYNSSDKLRISKKLKDQFSVLAEQSEEFGSIDIYAKYCSLIDPVRLSEVKKLLTLYFIIDQVWNRRFDKRYLTFLTTVLEDGHHFPDDIKMLSWNYDIQFQLAFKYFSLDNPILAYYPGLNTDSSGQRYKNKDYSLVQLNGIAGYTRDSKLGFSNFLRDYKSFNELIDTYVEESRTRPNLITFAWEKVEDLTFKGTLTIAKEIIWKSSYLVVVGYSFPFFNRLIDKEIMQLLLDYDGFEKIYYQDKFKTGDFIRAQFNVPERIPIISVQKADQFHIPFEF